MTKKQWKEEENLKPVRGKISVSEAGHLGGKKGGPRVRELIREGKEHEKEFRRRSSGS